MESYKKLKLELPLDHKIYREYMNFHYDHVEVKDNVYDKSRTFKQYVIPRDYFVGLDIDTVIKDLRLIPKIFKIESFHCYNWHRDSWRNIAINLTLNCDTDYIVMFAPEYPSDIHHRKIMYEKIEEVKYDPGKFLLFNTQIPHLSINRGSTDRYLLTIAHYSGNSTNAFQNKELDFTEFEKTIDYLKKKNFIDN